MYKEIEKFNKWERYYKEGKININQTKYSYITE